MAHVLVIGGTGLLGATLCREALAQGWAVSATYRSRSIDDDLRTTAHWERCDIIDAAQVSRVIDSIRPDLVVNAAYRQSGSDAELVCAEGAGNVASSTAEIDCRLAHVSTDLVFDGELGRPYTEGDLPRPLMDYGRAKLRGEQLVTSAHPDALVIRTSIIYGEPTAPQERLVETAVAGRDVLFFVDEWRSPIHVVDLANAVLDLSIAGRSGCHHVAGADRVNRLEFAQLLARHAGYRSDGLSGGERDPDLGPRPADVSLDSTAACELLGRSIPGAYERLDQSVSS